jgi:large subunit ribosomal protein L21
MYAIIKTGGKQYRVSVGDVVDVELLSDTDQGAQVAFGEVLFSFDGSNTKIGQPNIPDFQVFGEVLGIVKGDKVTSLKYKRSHNQCRKWGHRQKYTRVKITGIGNQRKDGKHGS